VEALVTHGWSVVAVPVAVACAVALAGRRLGRGVALLASLAPAWVLATGVSAALFAPVGGEGAIGAGALPWLGVGLDVGWAIDGLATVMLCLVGIVALLVIVFSDGYLALAEARPRYFALLALFTGAMSLLVIADGFLGLFIGWELVGACSYLLIGYWFTKAEAASAAMKAFLTTRVGDVGLLIALAVLFAEVGDLSFAAVAAAVPRMAPETVTVVALLLLAGAVGKSAQFPLHIWLPDAMEGPTPVSALIHAATMVAAGVFLLARAWPLLGASEVALMATLAAGVVTAVLAAAAACAQSDIKKMLAYSTISQLGFMFAAIGAGAWAAAIFHLVTHASFKALLFLGAGSVIHSTGTQEMRHAGGIARLMPLTAVTWFVGAAALAGVPPFAGFFSKDKILDAVWGFDAVWGAALFAASALTALYITRATVLVFFGAYRGHGSPHEGGLRMRGPLVALAVLAAILGFAGGPVFALIGGGAAELDLAIAAAATTFAVTGGVIGMLFARRSLVRGEVVHPPSHAGLSSWARSGFGWDTLVAAMITRPAAAVVQLLDRRIDRGVIDRIAEGAGTASRVVGSGFSALQSGDGQWYATMTGAGAVALLTLVALIGRGL